MNDDDIRKQRGEYLRRRSQDEGFTFGKLAAKVGVSEKTIRNLFSGEIKTDIQTVRAVCGVLGVEVSELDANTQDPLAPKAVGGYRRSQVQKYLGYSYCYRRSTSADGLFRSVFKFAWCKTSNSLRFHEYHKYAVDGRPQDYSQSGQVHHNPEIGTIQLVSQRNYDIRLMTCRPMTPDGRMRGVMLSQWDSRGEFKPIVSAVLFQHLRPLDDTDHSTYDEMEQMYQGHVAVIPPGHPDFLAAEEEITHIERNAVKINMRTNTA